MAKLVTVKLLFALATKQNWHLAQLDVNNVFLNGDLKEDVYINMPLGYMYQQKDIQHPGKLVCRLHKAIYGLKQASRQWYSKFSQAVVTFGFVQSKLE